MDVIVKDTNVLDVVIEYLYSRKLLLTCEQLISEAKLGDEVEANLNLEALQSYCWSGKWNAVQKYLLPFAKILDDFPAIKMQQVLFQQCYCESQLNCFDDEDEIDLQAIRDEATSHLNQEELGKYLHEIETYFVKKLETYKYPQAVLFATRMDCYNQIIAATKEVFHRRYRYDDEGRERLISILLKSSFYDLCSSYCNDRAHDRKSFDPVQMEKDSNEVVEYELKSSIDESCLSGVSPSLFYWLRSVEDNQVFKKQFVEEDVQIIVEKMNLITKNMEEDETDVDAVMSQQNSNTLLATQNSPHHSSHSNNATASTHRTSSNTITNPHHSGSTLKLNDNTSRINNHSSSTDHFAYSAPADTNLAQAISHTDNNHDFDNNILHKSKKESGGEMMMTTGKTPMNCVEGETGSATKPLSTQPLVVASTTLERVGGDKLAQQPAAASSSSLLRSHDNNDDDDKNEELSIKTAMSPHRIMHQQQLDKEDEPCCSSSINNHISTTDSYADFLAQKAKMRENSEHILNELKQKEELRKQLEKKLEESNSKSRKAASTTSLVSNARSVDSLRPLSPAKKNVSASSLQSSSTNHTGDQREHAFNYIAVEKTCDSAAIRSVSFHPGGDVYAVGTNSQSLKLCQVPSKFFTSLHKLDCSLNDKVGVKWSQPVINLNKIHKGSIYSSAWNKKGDIIATCSNDKSVKLFLFDEENQVMKTPPLDLVYHHGIVRDVAFIQHGGNDKLYLASAGPSDGVIYVTDCQTLTPLHKISAHKDQILSLYTWNTNLLASASQDGMVKMWDIRTADCIGKMEIGRKLPTSVCVDARGQHIAVGCTNAGADIYDINSLAGTLDTLKVHEGEVRSVRFHPIRSNILMTASYDHTACVVDYNKPEHTYARLRHHHDKLIQGRWHPSGLMLATTSADQTCVLSVVQEKVL